MRRRRNEDPILVPLLIGRVLELGAHDAHDREGRVAQEDLSPDGRVVAEQQCGQLVAQHRHPAPFGDVPIVDEAAPGLGDDVAHHPVGGDDSGDGGRGGLHTPPDAGAPGDELRADVLDFRNFLSDRRHVVRQETDRAAVGEALERLRGPPAEQDDDPVAQAVKALPGLALQPDTESQQDHHRHRAPGDSRDGQRGAELLGAQVGDEFTPHVR